MVDERANGLAERLYLCVVCVCVCVCVCVLGRMAGSLSKILRKRLGIRRVFTAPQTVVSTERRCAPNVEKIYCCINSPPPVAVTIVRAALCRAEPDVSFPAFYKFSVLTLQQRVSFDLVGTRYRSKVVPTFRHCFVFLRNPTTAWVAG